MTRAFLLGCLLALAVGAYSKPAEEQATTKVETQGKVDDHPLKSYLDRIKQSSSKPNESPLTEGKRVSGGTSTSTLDKIRQMVSQTEQRHKGHHGSPIFPMSLGNSGSNLFDFGKLSLGHPGAHNKHRRKNPPYLPNPNPTYSGANPTYGGANPTYGGANPYVPPSGNYQKPVVYPTYGTSSYPGEGLPGVDYSHVHPLSLYDYEHIWVQMLQEIYRILKDKDLLEDKHLASKVLDHLFKMLNDIKTLSKHTVDDDPSCPKIYHRSGDLCLSVDFITRFLNYHEARLYCQVVKGGDLVMFRDANEFADIQEFIHKIDPQRDFSYWIGLSENEYDINDWRFIDGRSAEYGAPYWGVNIKEKKHDKGPGGGLRANDAPSISLLRKNTKKRGPGVRRKANKSKRRPRTTEPRQLIRRLPPVNTEDSNFDDDQEFELEPGHDHHDHHYHHGNHSSGNHTSGNHTSGNHTSGYYPHDDDDDFALLYNDDFHYIHAVDFDDAEEYNAIPLCQYIPERDQTNFQYGEAIWEDWNDYNDWKGWGADSKEKYVEQPPHSHYKPYQPHKGKPVRPPYGGSGEGNYGYGGGQGQLPYGGGPVQPGYGGGPVQPGYGGGQVQPTYGRSLSTMRKS